MLPGDARLTLESEPDQGFDILVIDAFSSDAVPVHLLTREAFAIYSRHLSKDGVPAVHVTNRHLALAPVVRGAAACAGLDTVTIESKKDAKPGAYRATRVLASRDRAFLCADGIREAASTAVDPGSVVWNDGFNNLFAALRRRGPPPATAIATEFARVEECRTRPGSP